MSLLETRPTQTNEERIADLTLSIVKRMTLEVQSKEKLDYATPGQAEIIVPTTEENYWMAQVAISNCHRQFTDIGFEAKTVISRAEDDMISDEPQSILSLVVGW